MCVALLALFAVANCTAIQAAVWEWDGTDFNDTLTPDSAQGGAGIWNLYSTNWYVSPATANNDNRDWVNIRGTNIASFGGVGGLVTLDGGNTDRARRYADGLLFTVGGYTLTASTGDSLAVEGSNAIQLTSGVLSGFDVSLNTGVFIQGATTFTNSGTGKLILGGSVQNQTGFIGDLTIAGTGDTNVNVAIATTTGSLTKEGSGILTLNAANSYTGATTVNAGKLQYGIANAISTGAVSVKSGATLDVATFSDSVGAGTLEHGATISGSTGVFTVAGLTTNGGTVNFSSTGSLSINGNLTYNTDSGNETALIANNLGMNVAGTKTFTIADGVAAVDVDVTGTFSNPSALATNFVKAGAGVMRLGGSAANTNWSTGTTSVNDGTLILAKSASVDAIGGTGTITIGDGTGAAGSALLRYDNSSNQILNNAVTVNSDGRWNLNNLSETTSGALTVNTGGQVTIGTGSLTTAAAAITGSVTATGAGTFGSTAAITLNSGGTLTTATGAINAVGVTINSGGTLTTTTGNVVSTGAVAITGTLTSSGGNVSGTTLTVNAGGSLATGGGNVSGTGALTVNDSLTTSGGNITGFTTLAMTGGTINTGAGTYTMGGAFTGNASAATATIAGKLDLGAAGRTFTVADGTVVNDLNVTAAITSAGGIVLTKAGTGTMTLAANNSTAAGGVTLSAGQLNINHNNALGTGTLTLTAGTIDNTTGGTITNAGNNAISWGGNITFNGSNNLNLGNGAVTLTATRSVSTLANTLTIGGVVSGLTFGITKIGDGTLVLAGNNAYTGATTVSGGTVTLTGAPTAAAPLTFITGTANNNAYVNGNFERVSPNVGTNQNMGVLTFTNGSSNVMSSYGTSGTASLTFSSVAARGAGATGNFIVSGGVNGSTNMINSTAAFTANPGLFYDGADYAFKDGAGYLRQINYGSDAGTFNSPGGTSIATVAHALTSGSLSAQATATFTTLKISGASNVTLAGGATVTTTGILKTGNNASVISGGTGLTAATERVIRTNFAGDNLTIDSQMLGVGALTKTGDGTLVLTNSTNNYTGITYIPQGTLEVTANNALGTNAGATTVYRGGTLKLTNVNYSTAEGLTLNGVGEPNQTGALASSGTSTFAGLVLLGSNSTISVDSGTLNLSNVGTTTGAGFGLTLAGAGTGTFAGIIGTTTGSLTKEGTGTWALTGASTFTGAVNINKGTLQMSGATNRLPTGATINLADATFTKLDLNGQNTQVGFLSGGGGNGGDIALGGATLTLGGLTTATTYAGIISGNGGLTKLSTSTSLQTLTGGNSYTGLTTLSGGTLTMAGSNTALSGGITMTNTSTLNVNHASGLGTGTLTFQAASTLLTLNNTSGGTINVGTSPTQAWNNNFTFTGTNSLHLGSGAVTLGAATITATVSANTLTIGGDIGESSVGQGLTKAGAGTMILAGNNSYTGTTTVSAGILGISGSNRLHNSSNLTVSGTGTFDLGGFSDTVNVVSLSGTAGGITGTGTLSATSFAYSGASGTVTVAAPLAGSGATLTKSGAGTLVLSGDNVYTGLTSTSAGVLTLSGSNASATGGVTISGGTLNINNASALGNSGTLTITGTTPILNNSTSAAIVNPYATPQAWDTNFTFTGTSSLDLGTGAITMNATRTVTVSANTLKVRGAVGDSGSGFGIVKAGNGTLELAGNNSYTGPTTVSAGGLTISGNRTTAYTGLVTLTTGTLSMLGDNSNYSGGITAAAGTIKLGSATALGTGTVTLNGSVTFDNVTGGALTLTTGNTILLPGANIDTVFTGTNDLNLGTANLAMTGASGNRNIRITNPNSTLTIGGVISGTTSTQHLEFTGAPGRVILNGNNTYTGDTHATRGTLEINGNHASVVHVRYSVAEGRTTLTGHGTLAGIYNAKDMAGDISSPEDRPGSAIVSPGPNIGILTSTFVRPVSGLDFGFEFTATGSPNYGLAAASVNDVLRLTDPTAPIADDYIYTFPFTPQTIGALDGSNDLDIYFKVATLANGNVFRGGFYTDALDPLSALLNGSYRYYVLGDGNGTNSFNGQNYYTLAEYEASAFVTWTTVQEAANFGSGNVNGWVMQFSVTMDEELLPIPEPGTLLPLLLGSIGLVRQSRRRRQAA